jgi:hypothetical protein
MELEQEAPEGRQVSQLGQVHLEAQGLPGVVVKRSDCALVNVSDSGVLVNVSDSGVLANVSDSGVLANVFDRNFLRRLRSWLEEVRAEAEVSWPLQVRTGPRPLPSIGFLKRIWNYLYFVKFGLFVFRELEGGILFFNSSESISDQ